MSHPAWSSVAYLTGASRAGGRREGAGGGRRGGRGWLRGAAEARVEQLGSHSRNLIDVKNTRRKHDRPKGPTVIIDQIFDPALGRPAPEDPTRSCLVYPLAGSYCVFDGRLGHGVLDSFSKATRATVLVNWWTHQPRVRARVWRVCVACLLRLETWHLSTNLTTSSLPVVTPPVCPGGHR
jgi:hypothetical protein